MQISIRPFENGGRILFTQSQYTPCVNPFRRLANDKADKHRQMTDEESKYGTETGPYAESPFSWGFCDGVSVIARLFSADVVGSATVLSLTILTI